MLRIDVEFIPLSRQYDVAIAVDVLRMTTTAATLFSRGLSELHVVAELDVAREVATRNAGTLLIAERGGQTVKGSDGGNSPLEYMDLDLSDRQAVLCTTNGSKAVAAASASRHLLLGSIVNAAATANSAVDHASDSITIICAATDGNVSFDDVTAAACLIHETLTISPDAQLTDAAKLAYAVLSQPERGITLSDNMLHDLLWHSGHAQLLDSLGQAADVDYSSKLNYLAVVPMRRAGEESLFVPSD